jgi:NAD(P)-dependent dehydrogenase (short-subunit alcohol dehydrogenase family)
MGKIAVVTGAGSGVGQSVAWTLARKGWTVAILGRTEANLKQTKEQHPELAAGIRPFPCDIGKVEQVQKVALEITQKLGETVEVLVNAAGTNAPKRSLEILSLEDYHMMMDANLNGAYYCVQAFLPGMRKRGSGTIVNIVSDAGKLASPKAGPGYVISKFGLAGLTQAINAEERGNGVRACAIFPGDIDTPLLNKRPAPPPAEARSRMMQAQDIADCALLAIELPPRAIVEEILVRPR